MTAGSTAIWRRVSRRQRCPICDRAEWCGISADGALVCCMRTPSEWPTKNGGWIHRIAERPTAPRPAATRKRSRRRRQPTIDCDAIWREWATATQPGDVRRLGAILGVTPASLTRLGAVWAEKYHAWAFPMRNAENEMIGLRLRRSETGQKWAVRGSHQGVFVPDAQISDLCEQILVCEGPTDTAAALDLGFYAIGRPACSGQEDMALAILEGRHVVIVADRDEPKTRPDGSTWYPGQEGANRLAEHIYRKVKSLKMIKPLTGKDLRAWLSAGATAAFVTTVIENASYWRPANGR